MRVDQFYCSHKISSAFYQQTPLHLAAKEGRDYTARCLVENKANIDSKDNNGVSMTILVIVD